MDIAELRLRGRTGGEFIGRQLKNGFGVDEIATLPQSLWNYFDWCVEQGMDMEHWVIESDKIRKPILTFSENIWGGLWALECSRYKQGRPCPPSSPPEGYDDFLDLVEKGEIQEIP